MRTLLLLTALAVLAVVPATAQATISLVSPIPFSVAEGDRVDEDQFLARYTDAGNACNGGAQTLTVSWGDGTVAPGEIERTENFPGGCNYTVVGEHEYASAGTYALTVTACGVDNCVTSPAAVVTVTPAEMKGEAKAFGAGAGTPFTGEVAEFNSDNRLSQPGDFTAVIDWGDGSTSPGVIGGKDGRFDVSGQHTYASAGAYIVRVTLLRNGVPRITSDPATVNVLPPGAILATRISTPAPLVAATSRARPSLRMRTATIRRRALRRGLPIRISAPSNARSVRIAIVTVGARPRTVGRVTLRLRGGRVSDGVRVANLRVRLGPTLRGRLRPGRYALQFRIGTSGLVSAQFRVR